MNDGNSIVALVAFALVFFIGYKVIKGVVQLIARWWKDA